jgi:hypothetical protein
MRTARSCQGRRPILVQTSSWRSRFRRPQNCSCWLGPSPLPPRVRKKKRTRITNKSGKRGQLMTSKVSPLIEACRKNYPSLPTPTANRASPKFGRSDQSQSLICSQIFRESPPYQVPIAPEHPDDDSSFARLPRSTTHRPRPSTSTPTNRSSPPSFATVEPENLSHNHAGRHEITPAGRSPRRAHFPHLVTPHGRRCTSPSQEALRSLPLRVRNLLLQC